MFGLDAISAANGWAMAIAGALIVMAGLTVLSFVISQLHKVAALLEKGLDSHPEKVLSAKTDNKKPAADHQPVFSIDAAKTSLAPLAADLAEEFDLKLLYEKATANDLLHVHLSIRSLRETGVIVPAAEGLYRWQD